MEALAVRYRPKQLEDVCGQTSVVKILKRSIETQTIPNAILMQGASGCGKTTIARIIANMINNGVGEPIEIDAASNSSVDNVRQIIHDAQERSIDSKYKDLKEREYQCCNCDSTLDRDLNASINIMFEGLKLHLKNFT